MSSVDNDLCFFNNNKDKILELSKRGYTNIEEIKRYLNKDNESEYKRCYDCKFFATVYSGDSNWEIDETIVHCLKKQFKPQEKPYSWPYVFTDPEQDPDFLRQAEKCEHYKKGVKMVLDVEGETTIEYYKYDEELYNAAIEYKLKQK